MKTRTGISRLILIVSMLVLALLLVACEEQPPAGSGGEQLVTPAEEADEETTGQVNAEGSPERLAVIPGTTQVLSPPMNEAHLTSIMDGGATITFAEGVLQAADLSVGNVLAIEPTAMVPEGLLRRVVEVTQRDGQVQVQTVQATLEEAIETGFVEAHITLTPTDVRESTLSEGARHITARPAALADKFFLKIDETLDTGVRLKGEVAIQPSFDFAAVFDKGLKRLTMINTTTQTGRLELVTTVAKVGFDKKASIGSITFKPIAVFIGPFPVWLTPRMNFYVGVDGQLSAQITTAVNQEITFETGFVYEPDQVTWINNSSGVAVQFDQPDFSADAEARAYVRPQIDVLIYGVTGPYVAADAYVKLEAGPARTPLWRLIGGVRGVAGVKVQIVSSALAGYEVVLFDTNWSIDQAGESVLPGQQDIFEAEAMLSPPAPTLVHEQAPISATVNFGAGFSSIEQICFVFHFQVDDFYELFDPGDQLWIGHFPTPQNNRFGFSNNSSEPQEEQTICLGSEDPISRLFLDGQQDFGIEMEQGGVLISSLIVQITGAPQVQYSVRSSPP